MSGKHVFGALIAGICIWLFFNPSGNLSWWHWGDFAGPSWYAWLSLVGLGATIVPPILLGLPVIWYVLQNKLRALVFAGVIVGLSSALIFVVESKGLALLGNPTIIYTLAVFIVCFAASAAVGMREAKPAS